MDPQTLTLMACAALVIVTAVALWAARAARAEAARLGAEGAARSRELEQARTEAQVARAEGAGQARLLAERDEALGAARRETGDLRRAHEEARTACASAESRCAQTGEAVTRLEAAAERLRADHAEAIRVLREEGARVSERLRSVEEEFGRLGATHAKLQSERDERLASADREVARLLSLREEMSKEFQALARKTLQETGTEFSQTHQQKLQELLTPFREQVNRFETELREVHTTAKVDRATLNETIRELTSRTEMVSKEAVNLTRALKGDKQRQGAWGEAQLEQYLEHMGYVKDVHYTTQDSRQNSSGDRLRPDVILKLPGGRALVIDSKVSLVAYAAAIAAEDEEERTRHLRDHVRAVKSRIDELASKDYHELDAGAVEWVLLFMPIEGAVSAAWAHEADIAAYAMERRIGIAYPTTLLMALRTVKHLWDVENRNSNAEKIAQRGGLIYDKLAGFLDSFKVMERALDSAKAAQVKALGQLSEGKGNLLSQVEQLKKLGAKTSKSLSLAAEPEPDPEPEDVILGLPGGSDEAPAPTHEPPRGLPAAE